MTAAGVFAGTAIRFGAFAAGRLLLIPHFRCRLNRYGSNCFVVQMQHPQVNVRQNGWNA